MTKQDGTSPGKGKSNYYPHRKIRSLMNKPMKKKKQPMEDSAAPFPNGKEAAPHYTDTIDPELIKPTPKPTPPNAEPSAPGSMKMPDNATE